MKTETKLTKPQTEAIEKIKEALLNHKDGNILKTGVNSNTLLSLTMKGITPKHWVRCTGGKFCFVKPGEKLS